MLIGIINKFYSWREMLMDQLDWELMNMISIEKSASKVAQKLFISQPAVSYRLQKMEEEYGTPLFIRSNKGILLTDAGERLLSFADRMLDQYSQISMSVNAKTPYVDTITIGAPYTLTVFAIRLIREFCKEYPQTRFHFYTDSSQNIIRRFREGNLQMAFVRGVFGEIPNMKTLFRDSLRLISMEPVTLESLVKIPFIDYNMASVQRHWINLWANTRLSCGLERTFYADSLRACYQMVESGLGWSAVTSLILLQRDLSSLNTYVLTDNFNEPLQVSTQFLCSDEALSFNGASKFIDLVFSYDWENEVEQKLAKLPNNIIQQK